MKIKIYTDGSCIDNPGPGGWAFLMEIVGGRGKGKKIIKKQGGNPLTTNNRMELLAVIEALREFEKICASENAPESAPGSENALGNENAPESAPGSENALGNESAPENKCAGQNNPANIEIYSDSSWVVKTMNENWKRKKNLDLWDDLIPLLPGKKVTWNWVRGHAGHPENEDCDRRALSEAIKQKRLVKNNPGFGESPKKNTQKNLFDI